jgi:hypothetical protein
MTRDTPQSPGDWTERERAWQRRLGKFRLGAEPFDVQLARRRRVIWALTGLILIQASIYLSLFGAFRRPDVGIVAVLLILFPIAALPWIRYHRLRRRVSQYERERHAYEAQRDSPART